MRNFVTVKKRETITLDTNKKKAIISKVVESISRLIKSNTVYIIFILQHALIDAFPSSLFPVVGCGIDMPPLSCL